MFWAIALGAAAGGVSRHYLASSLHHRIGSAFPWGTLVVNVTGSLLLGFLVRYALATPAVSAELRALLTSGFCGGYTTFSTFSFETVALLEKGDYRRGGTYVLASVILSLVGTLCGSVLARQLLAAREPG